MRSDDQRKASTLYGQLEELEVAVDRARLMVDALRASVAGHDPHPRTTGHLVKLDGLVLVIQQSTTLALLHLGKAVDAGTPLEDDELAANLPDERTDIGRC